MFVRAWRLHSKTIVGLAAGPLICLAFVWVQNDRLWDSGITIGGTLIAIGLNGLWDIYFREVARPEE